MPDQVESLFRELDDNRHPDYESKEEEWGLYKSILGESEIDVEKYLPKGEIEDHDLYELRKKLSQWIPETQLAVESLVSALYDQKPVRDLKDARFDQFIDDVNRNGLSFNEFIEGEATKLLAYGTVRILVNIPEVMPGEGRLVPTRADEKEQNIRPFLVSYDPLSVPAWDIDDRGRLVMARIKEERWGIPPTGGRKYVKFTTFIEYTRESISQWEFMHVDGDKRILNETSEKANIIGRVPMIISGFPNKTKPMIGSSFIKFSSRADVQKFQFESDIGYDGHVHAHPTFWSKTEDKPRQIGVGSQAFIHLNPENDESVGYVDMPNSAFEALSNLIEDKRRMIFRQANTDPMGVLESGTATFQASGVSRAWSFATSEARILSKLAGAMVNVERDIFDVVSLMQGGASFAGEIQYPEEFNLSSVNELLNQLEIITEHINSPELIKHIHKRIAAAKVGDASSDLLKAIIDEIDKNDLIRTPASRQIPDPTPNISNILKFDEEEEEGSAKRDTV